MNDEQIDRLVTHATQLALALVRETGRDGVIRTALPDGTVSVDLPATHHLIEVLATLDARIFGDCIISALRYMMEPSNLVSAHPFTMDSYALVCQRSDESSQLFREAIASHQLPDGAIPVFTAYLGGGDYFSTLWGVRILARYSREIFQPEIRRALGYLKERREIGSRRVTQLGYLGFLLADLDKDDLGTLGEIRDRLVKCAEDGQAWNGMKLIERLFILEDLLEIAEILPSDEIDVLLNREIAFLFQLDEEVLQLPKPLADARDECSDSLFLECLARATILAIKYLEGQGVTELGYAVNGLVHSDYRSTRYTALQTRTDLEALWEIYGPMHQGFSAYHEKLERAGKSSPLGRSIFLMMPFLETLEYRRLTEVIRAECAKRGLLAVRVDDPGRRFADGLWENLVINMLSCKYAIAIYVSEQVVDVTSRDAPKFFHNPNVALEFGFFKSRGQEVLILKDKRSTLPTDLQGFLWSEFDIKNPDTTVPPHLSVWLDHVVAGTAEGEKAI